MADVISPEETSPPVAETYASGNPWVNRSLGIMDTFLAWVSADTRALSPFAAPSRILIANTGHLGDAILATSVLPVLRSAFPNCHIGFLIGSWSRPALLNHALVDEIHVFDHWRLNRGSNRWWEKLQRHEATRRQALDEIQRRRYDVAIDLRPYFGNAVPLLRQADIPVRVGYPSGGFGPLLTHPVAWRRRAWHMVDYHRALLRLLPLEAEHLARLQPSLRYRDQEAVSSPLMEGSTPYVVLHMGSGAACKEWPAPQWRALAERLEAAGHAVVFTGAGAAEAERCEEVAAGLAHATNLCSRLTWPELVTVVRRARLLVAVDSMAGHLAAALDTPCVVISNGINPPALWQPRTKACRVLLHPVPCAPCFKPHGCATMACVRQIRVDQVWTAIKELLLA